MDYLNDARLASLFHPFPASRLTNGQVMWVAPDFEADGAAAGMDEEARKALFGDMFSYMIPGGICFDELRFDTSDTITMQAERYGGMGIGDNGGGVRCGNVGKYQIKGIGQNPLAGSKRNLLHSYGGLSAVDALYETIYANVLQKIMPVGVARIHGVILTSSHAAYNIGPTEDLAWGALMVRDTALRPAHFLRAPSFKPSDAVAPTLFSDVGRARMVNRGLLNGCGNITALIQFLGNFLMRCANQFAFARVARIMHGSVSPSNMCFDGRWVDLTLTQFLPSDQNNAGFFTTTASFYEECTAPLVFLRENIDTLNKYNGTNLQFPALANYYMKQLASCFRFHMGYLFALPVASLAPELVEKQLEYVKDDVMALLSAGKVVRNAFPLALDRGDPMLGLLEAAFLAAAEPARAGAHLAAAPLRDGAAFGTALAALFDAAHAADSGGASRGNFVLAAFLCAFKRAALPEYFYHGRLEYMTIRPAIATGNAARMAAVIADSIDVGDWAFAAPGAAVTLYRSPQCRLEYETASGRFVHHSAAHGGSRWFAGARELLGFVRDSGPGVFVRHDYDFGPYLQRMLATAAAIEHINGGLQ